MTQPYHHGSLRTALLEAAEAILERDGIGALTLRAAAREAGVSHAAPAHHFGDLTGLLSELAASGFNRLRETIEARSEAAGADLGARSIARGRGYVGFARSHPGLFRLMFRSERLNWSSEALAASGQAAFALLTQDDPLVETGPAPSAARNLGTALTRWSLLHGLSSLLVDGRLGAMAAKVPGADIETLIDGVLTSGLRLDAGPPATNHEGPSRR
jgi:AcrR family transcriptional regulator